MKTWNAAGVPTNKRILFPPHHPVKRNLADGREVAGHSRLLSWPGTCTLGDEGLTQSRPARRGAGTEVVYRPGTGGRLEQRRVVAPVAGSAQSLPPRRRPSGLQTAKGWKFVRRNVRKTRTVGRGRIAYFHCSRSAVRRGQSQSNRRYHPRTRVRYSGNCPNSHKQRAPVENGDPFSSQAQTHFAGPATF